MINNILHYFTDVEDVQDVDRSEWFWLAAVMGGTAFVLILCVSTLVDLALKL